MRSGIILLEHSSWSAHQWQDMRLQDVLNVLCRCQVALDSNQLTPAYVADGSQNSDATTTMRRRLIHARSRISPTTPSVNPSSSVVALQQESGLVTEPNMSPMVPESPGLMLVCPQHPGLAVASHQHIPLVGSISPQPSSVNTVSHCLPAGRLVARQCLNS